MSEVRSQNLNSLELSMFIVGCLTAFCRGYNEPTFSSSTKVVFSVQELLHSPKRPCTIVICDACRITKGSSGRDRMAVQFTTT